MKTSIVQGMKDARRLARAAGPYVLLEILLPGGTLVALLLYLYRSGQLRNLGDAIALGREAVRTAARAFDQLALVWQPLPGEPGGGSAPPLFLTGR